MTAILLQSKVCTKCGADKAISEFYRQSAKRGGYHSWCRDCCRQSQRDYRRTDAGKAVGQRRRDAGHGAAAARKYRYGLTPADFQRMLTEQGHACAICGDEIGADAHVDHDHSCCPGRKGKEKTCGQCVRALLCKCCTLMLGYAQDQPSRLLAAAAYLVSRDDEPIEAAPADDAPFMEPTGQPDDTPEEDQEG